jgi:hypothetical protein
LATPQPTRLVHARLLAIGGAVVGILLATLPVNAAPEIGTRDGLVELPQAFKTRPTAQRGRQPQPSDVIDDRAVCGDPVSARGFLLDRDGFSVFGVPGSISTAPTEINNRGDMVGNFIDPANVQHGFLRLKLKRKPGDGYTTVDAPNASAVLPEGRNEPLGMNEQGDIVGAFTDARLALHAYVRTRSGDFHRLDVPGATGTSATGINARQQIVGAYSLDDTSGPLSTYFGFLLEHSEFSRIDPPADLPDADYLAPFDINDHGEIAGFYVDAAMTKAHGFVRSADGDFTTIDAPGADFGTSPLDINNRGEVIGSC